MLPGTIDGMKHICYFRHALALDERRVKFLPEYAYGGTATDLTKAEEKKPSPIDHESPHDNLRSPSSADADGPISNNESSNDKPPINNEGLYPRSSGRIKSKENRPHTIEVWFAGTHSDM